MPLVRISVHNTTPSATRHIIANTVYDAMRATLNIPENDRFIVLTAHPEGELYIDPGFMGMTRTEDFVLIHITLRHRAAEVKQAFFAETVRLLHERAAIAPDDIMIVATENDLADWSFGRGQAQYILNPPPGALQSN
jgi:phenylpyruvate tautomerase PptA (4-oxalocrotonate tautomerase family)